MNRGEFKQNGTYSVGITDDFAVLPLHASTQESDTNSKTLIVQTSIKDNEAFKTKKIDLNNLPKLIQIAEMEAIERNRMLSKMSRFSSMRTNVSPGSQVSHAAVGAGQTNLFRTFPR
jgi:hypothetical protein